MSGEVEAAGALATAGAVTGAIEPGDAGAAGEGPCLNCGTQLSGARYCGNCGQAAQPHRTLGGLVGEFLSSLYNFDTKAWRTLPRLLVRPGTLTREYVYGKRARYISPLAAFLLAIFLMFFAFSTIEAPREIAGTPEEQRAGLVEGLAAARETLADAQQELAEERAAPPPTDGRPVGLDVRLAEQAVRLAQAEVERREQAITRFDEAIAAREAAANAPAAMPDQVAQPTPEQATPAQQPAESPITVSVEAPSADDDNEENVGWGPGETWQDGVRRWAQSENFSVIEGSPEINERIRRKLENPDLALYSIQEAASKFSFLLAPMSLPFIALLFLWKRGVTLYDHMAYALYSLAFAALLFSSVVLLGRLPVVGNWTGWLLLALPVHMYFHIGGAYALGWFSALWRTVFMLFFAYIVAIIFTVLVVVLGLAG